MAFSLNIHPWIHICKYENGKWTGDFLKQDNYDAKAESLMTPEEHRKLMIKRNSIPGIPLINFTTQYGIGCFEGLKAFPQPDGTLKVFRPDRNTSRMAASMKGLRMPPIDEKLLLDGILGTVRRNSRLGFAPTYKSKWEKNHWGTAEAIYIRPFAYSEPGIGIDLSRNPWVITVCTSVSNYFASENSAAITTKRIRATPNGTGGMKITANYTISALAKAEAIDAGCMEAIFLDATHREYIEEGSASNFFAVFPGNKVVTPLLHDTILPGINRSSVIDLLKQRSLEITERDVSIHEVLDNSIECFVTGTAAGIIPLSSITHESRKITLQGTKENSLSNSLLKELKGIQYGAIKDLNNWMMEILA